MISKTVHGDCWMSDCRIKDTGGVKQHTGGKRVHLNRGVLQHWFSLFWQAQTVLSKYAEKTPNNPKISGFVSPPNKRSD